jgi:hypothetical protein
MADESRWVVGELSQAGQGGSQFVSSGHILRNDGLSDRVERRPRQVLALTSNRDRLHDGHRRRRNPSLQEELVQLSPRRVVTTPSPYDFRVGAEKELKARVRRMTTPTVKTVALLEVSMFPLESVKLTWAVSVPVAVLVYVKLASPLAALRVVNLLRREGDDCRLVDSRPFAFPPPG